MNRKPPSTNKKPKGNTSTPPPPLQQPPSQNASSSSRPPAISRAEAEERSIFREHILENKDSCSICLEELLDNYLARLSCGHKTCAECLTEMFKGSITDESRYPPKCCYAIRLATVRPFIHQKVLAEFERKMVEWETQNRTYCSDTECGAFIHPNLVNGIWASCPRCVRLTCTVCKGVAHGGRPCPKDEATQKALGLMEKEGYKICARCKNGVELMQGCNHITCVCGHQFCYICGVNWKNCSCPAYGHPTGTHIDMDGTYHAAGERRRNRPDNMTGWPEAQARQARGGHHDQVPAPAPAPAAEIEGWPEAQARRVRAQIPPRDLEGWVEAQARRQDTERRETRRRETEARRQQTQGRRDKTLAALENLDLAPERRARQQPLAHLDPFGMFLPPPQQWPQPRNQAPLPGYGQPPPPARQDMRPQHPAGNLQGRRLCDRSTGWCGCGGFHDAHNPPNPGWDRRR